MSDDAKDAARYRWLRDKAASQFTLTAWIAGAKEREQDNEYTVQWFGKMGGEHMDRMIDDEIARAASSATVERT